MTVSAMSATPKKSLKLFSGSSHPELAEEVAKQLDVTVTPQAAYKFANGEIFGRLNTEAALPTVSAVVRDRRPDLVLHEAADYAHVGRL